MTPLTTAPTTSPPTAAEYANNLIGGEWVPSVNGATFDNLDPTTGDVIGQYPQSTAEDVDRAVAAAKAAFTL